MEFDKRNPFAAWGYEQEKYTSDTAPKFESLLSMEDSAFVNDGAVTEGAGEYVFDEQLVFFTNNEHIAESLNIRRRKVDGKDIDVEIADNYNNAELNYYGIQPQDLMADTKAHAKSSEEPVLTGNEISVKATGYEEGFISAFANVQTTWYDVNETQITVAPTLSTEDGYVKIKFNKNLGYWVTSGENTHVFPGENVTEVILPDTLTKIGSYSFDGFQSLTNIVIPDSVTSIGDHTFQGCLELTNFTFPNSVTEIEGLTFKGCTKLTTVTIGNRTESIKEDAFYACSSLESIDIPDSVTSIGESAFYNCSSLASVTIMATEPPTLGAGAFYGTTESIKIYVPQESVESYKAAESWDGFEYSIFPIGYEPEPEPEQEPEQ